MYDFINFEWKNMNYYVKSKEKRYWNILRKKDTNERIHILKNVSGCLQSGNLVAILGPSGSGKTTLLAALSQRISGNITGDILINKEKMNKNSMKNLSAFVPQYHVAIDTLTPQEHLFFMSELTLHNKSKDYRAKKINNLLIEFNLKNLKDIKIKLLSGGEQKKLLLASELLVEKCLIFSDEITTGLDSFNAFNIIKKLKKLSEMKRKLIICSIHQPSSFVFHLFTHFILMDNGQIVYQGKLNQAYHFFSNLGYKCPNLYNPAEFYINLVSAENHYYKDSSIIIFNAFKKQSKVFLKEIPPTLNGSIEKLRIFNNNQIKQLCWVIQVYFLLTRLFINMKRTFVNELIKTCFVMATSIAIAFIYAQVDVNNESAVQDIQGAIVLINSEIIFNSLYEVIYYFPSNLPIARREIGENLYKLSAFYFSYILFLIPQIIIKSSLYLGIIFITVGFLKTLKMYLLMSLSLSLAGITAMATGCAISAVAGTSALAAQIAAPIGLLFLILGGFYIQLNSVPILKHISVFYYATEVMSIQYWKSVDFKDNCTILKPNGTCLNSGESILKHQHYSTESITIIYNYIGLIIINILMHIIGYIGLRNFIRKVGFY